MKNKLNHSIVGLMVSIGILVWGLALHAGTPGSTTSEPAQVIQVPQNVSTLQSAWDWALKKESQTNGKTGFTLGYSIKCLMSENSFMGCWRSNESRKSLNEIIYGVKLPGSFSYSDNKSLAETAKAVIQHSKHASKSDKKIIKDVAILFYFDSGASFCHAISVSNLELSAKLEKGNFYWLGKDKKDDESIPFVKSLYRRANDMASKTRLDIEEFKEDALMSIAIHDNHQLSFPFLKDVLTGNEPDEVREKAAFWIGQSQIPSAPKLLLQTVERDKSEEVREKAVFALYLHQSDEAAKGLIKIAKEGRDRAIRKKAVFWLGQRAVKHCEEILEDIATSDKDTDIQKAAIFALSQLSKDKGVPRLIKIAKTHSNLSIRKKAIFWLSQSDDPRALDTIIALIEK